MPANIRKLSRFLDQHFEESVASFCLSVIAVCVFLQVVLRYGFGTALTWTEELAGFCMAWAVYMGAALGVRERFHIRILVGVFALPTIFQLPLVLMADLMWLLFNLLMVWYGFEYVGVLWTRTSISPALGIDQVWPQSIIVIGYLLMTLRLLQIYVIWWTGGRKDLPGKPPEFQEEDVLELEKP